MDYNSDTYRNANFEAHNPTIAAIDLGTNSCRLLIARVNVAGLQTTYYRTRPSANAWRVVDSMARVVRLGEGLHKDDTLGDDAIDRAIEALAVCRDKIKANHVRKMRAVATEACRRAINGQVLVDRARDELGMVIEIITAEEEARLALTGCAAILDPKIPYSVVFDIGGGSTEVVWLRLTREGFRRPGYPVPFEVIDSISLPYGVVTVSEAYGNFSSSPGIHGDIRNKVKTELEAFFEKNAVEKYVAEGQVQMVGTSGTVTTLAAMNMGLGRYERRVIDGVYFNFDDLDRVTDEILAMSPKDRVNHPCIGGGRTELVVVGSAILQGICHSIDGVKRLKVADRGVREGVLVDLLREVVR